MFLKLIHCHCMRVKNSVKILLVILMFFSFLSCSEDEKIIEYRNSNISGIVDSMIYFIPFTGKKQFFLVKDRWYVVPARYYAVFFHYTSKGDSLYKDAGRWDIYVYKKKNGEWVEKYFRGAQDSWK